MQEQSYEFSDQPLYTLRAIDLLDGRQQVRTGDAPAAEIGFVSEESGTLEDYLETLELYNEVLQQGYEDISNIPHPETVLGRVEDDMDLLARGRHQLLDQEVSAGETRRELLEGIFRDEEYDTPVMTDTWIITR